MTALTGMTGYPELGLQPVVNAAGRYTALGGSVMPSDVLDAMRQAARCHVQMRELHRRVGARLAELTGNDAAYVTAGAAAGIVLAVLACRTGPAEVEVARLSDGPGDAAEVLVHRAHHIPYLPAIRLAGAEPVPFGSVLATTAADLRAAISPRTVALMIVAGEHLRRGSLPLDQTIEIAREHRIPVVVDAAAQLPPRSNLWRFTRDHGADLALFSGGKDLRGPQASGLMVGRRDLIDAAALHASPNQRLARALKTGKEEVMGLLAAVEGYLRLDEDGRRREWLAVLDRWSAALGSVPGIRVERSEMNEAGQPIPRLIVHLPAGDDGDDGGGAPAVIGRLLTGEPAVAAATVSPTSIALTADCLLDGEEHHVAPALKAALAATGGSR